MTIKSKTSLEFFPPTHAGYGDIDFDGSDVLLDTGLDTTFFLSVYTDTRAEDSDITPNSDGDKRGWWGDAILGMNTGSRVWLYSVRGKLTTSNVANIRNAMIDAVTAQMIETGLIESVSINYIINTTGVEWSVVMQRRSEPTTVLNYQELWDGQLSKITKGTV